MQTGRTLRRQLDPDWWTGKTAAGEPLADLLRRHDISAVMRFLRSRGLSRNALARMTGLTETRVRAVSNGDQQVTTYEVLERIAEGLGVPRHVMGLGYGQPGDTVLTPASISRWFTLEAGCLVARPGRFLPNSRALVLVQPIQRHPDGHLSIGQPSATRGFTLAVDEDSSQVYAQDTRRSITRGRGPDVTISGAHLLDDFTLGVLWAAICMDEALLDDDRMLAAGGTGSLARSSLAQTTAFASQLSQASRMWLGSDVCAAHIMQKLPELSEVPVFWTREQRGEEASNWLLFTHKYEYLQSLSKMLPAQGTSRTFCVPPAAVIASAPAERVILLLALALMESFKIKVQLSVEPGQSAVDGFVLDQRRAIVANWVSNDGTWTADLTDSWPTVSSYVEAVAEATQRTVLTGQAAHQRLQQAADYLGLDWRWICDRSTALSAHGFGGLFTPRSRLLSIAGVDRACRFLAGLARPAGI